VPKKHRHQEWLKFLRVIDQTIPAIKQIYLICDNFATHKHARVQLWLQTHNCFHVRFTPTSASWLNIIERFYRDLTHSRTRRGAFRLPGSGTTHYRHRRLHRRPQQVPKAHMDRQGKRHPRKGHPRPDRAQ
jgi:hypothetical protein